MQMKVHELTQDFFDFFGDKHQFYSLPNKAETGYYGTFTKMSSGLQRDNEARKDIYFTVNEAKPGIQRTKDKFVRARAVYIDDDGDSKHGGKTENFPIPPNITVQTSPGKHHYYWFTSTDDGDALEAVLRGMAEKYHGDPSTTDRLRILRAPGFIHNGSGQVVTFEAHHDKIYTWSEIMSAFPPQLTSPAAKNKEVASDNTFSVKEAIDGILSGDEVHGARVSLALHWANTGMPKQDALATLNGYVEDAMRAGNVDAGRAMERLGNMKQAVDSAYLKVEAENTIPKYVPVDGSTSYTVLSHPPGAMGIVVDDILSKMIYPSEEMAICIAFHCVSVFGGGHYHLDGKTVARKRTILALTGRGKAIAGRYFGELIRGMALNKNMFNPHVFKGMLHYSATGLHTELAEHRIRSYLIQEAGLMGKSKAGTTDEIRAYFLKAVAADYAEGFDSKMFTSRNAESRKANESLKTVYSIIPILLSESVPDQYTDILKSDDSFRSGDVGREEIFFIDPHKPAPRRKIDRIVNPDVVKMMFNLARAFEATNSERGDDPTNPDKFIEVDYSAVDEEMYQLAIKYNDDYNDSARQLNYVEIALNSRMYERIRTTVLALAIADSAYKKKKLKLPVVTKEHLTYAVEYHEALSTSLRSQATGAGALADPLEQCVQRVTDRCISFGTLAKDQRESHDYKNKIVRRSWLTDVLDRSKFKPFDNLINVHFRGNRKAAFMEIMSALEDKRVLIPITNIDTKVPLWKINI